MQALIAIVGVLVALGAGAWQAHFKSIFHDIGQLGRDIRAINNDRCTVLDELPACEKIVLHQPTGLLFMACSTTASRVQWTPALHRLNASARSTTDYVAIFDPGSRSTRKLALSGFSDPRGLNTHGMDVVPSSTSTSELFVYFVNQRPPLAQMTADHADAPHSSVEIFRMNAITASTLEHVATVDSPLIRSPNDVAGSPDGKSFWLTNDGSHERGFAHHAHIWLKTTPTNVVHCVLGGGCKVAAEKLRGANGIVRAPGTDIFYVASSAGRELRAFERQADDTLVLTDVIDAGIPQDNLSVDADGGLWAAGMPKTADRVRQHFARPEIPSASTALWITLNTGRSAFFGEKYKVTKALEDDGNIVSGSTTAVYDSQRMRIFMSGLSANTVMCELPKEKFDLEAVAKAAAA